MLSLDGTEGRCRDRTVGRRRRRRRWAPGAVGTRRSDDVADAVVCREVLVGGVLLLRGIFLQVVDDDAPFVDVSSRISVPSVIILLLTPFGP